MEQNQWPVDVQNAKPSLNDGLRNETPSVSPLSSLDCLLLALARQTEALERQSEALEVLNERILGLLEQTAVLVDSLLSKDAELEEEEGTYLDGSRVKHS